jgi:hypothetical protein
MMYGFPIFAAGGALSFLVGFWLHYQLAKHKDVELDIFGVCWAFSLGLSFTHGCSYHDRPSRE